MDKILHQLIGSLSHYLQGFIHTRWLARFLNHQQYHPETLNDSVSFWVLHLKAFLDGLATGTEPENRHRFAGEETEGLPENLRNPEVSRRRLLMVQKSYFQPPGKYI